MENNWFLAESRSPYFPEEQRKEVSELGEGGREGREIKWEQKKQEGWFSNTAWASSICQALCQAPQQKDKQYVVPRALKETTGMAARQEIKMVLGRFSLGFGHLSPRPQVAAADIPEGESREALACRAGAVGRGLSSWHGCCQGQCHFALCDRSPEKPGEGSH